MKFYDLQKITAEHADEYRAAVNRVIDCGWFLQGSEVAKFEKDYARYIGTRHCVSVASGLDALRLIIRAYKERGEFQDGDEIIVPANTYIATILAISDNNLVPVLVEPTWEHLEIDIDRIEEAITPKTKCIMIVHLYGRSAYDERLKEICNKYNLRLLEDCAQAQGAKPTPSPSLKGGETRLGSVGDAAAHSFYPGKNLGAFGDAGAVTTDDDELASVIRALANYGSQKKYVFEYIGMNSRMSELNAAVLDVKLKYLDEDNKKRQRLAAYYYEHINNPLITLPKRLPDAENVYHQFPIFCERRDELQEYLKQQGIQTLIHYPIPPHKQECYRKPTPSPSLEGRGMGKTQCRSLPQFSLKVSGMGEYAARYGAHTADPTMYGLLKTYAEENRKSPTEAERAMWQLLKSNNAGLHFRRQHIIQDFIVDFYCVDKGLSIELDGGYHRIAEQVDADKYRTEQLAKLGITELRFTNEELLQNSENVMEKILSVAADLPSLQGGVGGRLPITEKIHAQELSIPMSQVVTEEEAKMVVDVVNSFK